MKIGYARVSTAEQNIDFQERELRQAGAEVIHTDTASGTAHDRPGLSAALASLQAGDTLMVWHIDRLGRSLPHLVSVIAELGERRVHFQSLQNGLNTSSAEGRLLFNLIAALAEFERTLIVERTKAGVAAARARGVRLGRRPSLTQTQVAHARTLIASGESASTIASSLGVGRSTLYRALGTGGE